ncbi:MAG TPA: cytochrome b5 domain-containing protein [Chloroflexota bacterium]|nr:cytochrome b5 domain-containing protein [Chloroflexota bacterium]
MIFTLEDLARYHGRDGAPAYIAYRGVVYDLSGSYQWRNGKHQVTHLAGRDLTGGLKDAPHGEDLLDRFPILGKVAEVASAEPVEGPSRL